MQWVVWLLGNNNDIEYYLKECKRVADKTVSDLAKREGPKIAKELEKKYIKGFTEFQDKKIRDAFNRAVTEFYEQYDPNKYKRRGDTSSKSGGMYNFLYIEYASDGQISFVGYDDTADVFKNNGSGSGLFDYAFMNGWHGGSPKGDRTVFGDHVLDTPHPNPGVPYWRDPTTYPRKFLNWGERAYVSSDGSPYDKSEEYISEAWDEIDEEFENVVDKISNDLNNILTDRINSLLQGGDI